MQPEIVQPPLPFEDEVLLVLHKQVLESARWLDTSVSYMSMLRDVTDTATEAGFRIVRTVYTTEVKDGTLHTSLRADAERI